MDTDQNANNIGDLTTIVTWSVLLSKCTRFAQASVAFPKGELGDRWRASVAPMIGLQSIAFALGEAATLPVDERLLGIDRAGLMIRAHSKELDETWRAEPMPEELLELIADARAVLERAAHLGAHASVASDGFVMPDVHALCAQAIDDGYEGHIFAAMPGTILREGTPALVARPGPLPFDVPGLDAESGPSVQAQVYRSIVDTSGAVRDTVVPFHEEMPAGRPLLEHIVEDGALTRIESDASQVEKWITAQARSLDGRSHELVVAPADATDGA